MPVIVATWEVETRRIMVSGQLISKERPHLKGKKLGVLAHARHPSNGGKQKAREVWSRPARAKSETISKMTRQKGPGVAQVGSACLASVKP
jgi:hypothetical protein